MHSSSSVPVSLLWTTTTKRLLQRTDNPVRCKPFICLGRMSSFLLVGSSRFKSNVRPINKGYSYRLSRHADVQHVPTEDLGWSSMVSIESRSNESPHPAQNPKFDRSSWWWWLLMMMRSRRQREPKRHQLWPHQLPRQSRTLVVWPIYLCFWCFVLRVDQTTTTWAFTPGAHHGDRQCSSSSSAPSSRHDLRTSVLYHQQFLSSARTSTRSSTVVVVSSTSSSNSSGGEEYGQQQQQEQATVRNRDDNEDGIRDFETWFAASVNHKNDDGTAWVDDRIRHGRIGSLRGLIWREKKNTVAAAPPVKTRMVVATIPRSMVLSTDYSPSTKEDNNKNSDWDAKLAMLLWNAVKDDGKSSAISGYCRLLLQGSSSPDKTPLRSTAPHALRRWSAEQRNMLAGTTKGKKLLQLEADQTKAWRRKYSAAIMGDKSSVSSSSSASAPPLSWDQFQWAMEAVHSRAFCGVQTTSGNGGILPSLAGPVLAAAAIWYAYQTLYSSSDILLVTVTATAFSVMVPTLLGSRQSAVLLPLIDSANHWNGADSSIAFDPLKGSFELTIGPNCLVPEQTPNNDDHSNDDDDEGPKTQLYINYGVKSTEEFLLNYGFLPDVSPPLHRDEDDDYRRRLAERYQQ
jgi:hypothetical protein